MTDPDAAPIKARTANGVTVDIPAILPAGASELRGPVGPKPTPEGAATRPRIIEREPGSPVPARGIRRT
ncbi:hypothetical protein GCM10017567_23390 [Amycolatopsis bullii]|uniref:Uncharacterized protein n=1 Tax=Amycolatopsis bullii TaxID=941987 RepID=A0ABQ3K795_9PSEU|nr:hypothetical protein GCM10017567_23390 [Amycolatopsis bullii]